MIHTLLEVGATEDKLDIVSLILVASPVVKGVLLLLGVMSLSSWYVIGSKAIFLSRALGRSSRFLDAFWKTQRLDDVWKLTEESSPSLCRGRTECARQHSQRSARAVRRPDWRRR